MLPDHWSVVELSSYQVADLTTGPVIGVVTSLYKKHTDWHLDETTYRRDKLRLVGLRAFAPACSDRRLRRAAVASCVRFNVLEGWRVADDGVRHPDGGFVAAEDLPLRGRHNAVSLCAALAAVNAAGLSRPELPSGLRGAEPARPAPHDR